MTKPENLKPLMAEYQERVNTALAQRLPATTIHPARLHEAMRYAVFNGGKRIRPILIYATAKAVGSNLDRADGPACAVELIHAYSLVHDDLPAMDDDDLRRGKATCHRAFDEATAILTGDALQTQAFYALSHDQHLDILPETQIKMINLLATASGSRGMAGGQAIDLESEGQQLDIAQLENMHIHKTGALIRASVMLGALCQSQLDSAVLRNLTRYAEHIGLAFQIRDDILDIEASTETLGKSQGSDIAKNKATYPALIGLKGAKERAQELHQEALACLETMDANADPLRWISAYIVDRGN
ncbi:(2E,6E)-farnesyl diphosphate synthase [hydrothermal vent metagenome]|uniref:(2E,6E)-farnesyl diphosphate synthase n=1 Tax=hydrothermal vent metagenome TaxID=652676 RepID=A0A3B0ZGZ9_9ZZZZ